MNRFCRIASLRSLRPTAACLALAFALVACSPDADEPTGGGADAGATADGVGYFRTDVSSPDAAPWPEGTDTSLPGCEPWRDAWSLPDLVVADLAIAAGALQLQASAALQPLGHDETVTVTVVDAKGKPDADATGVLTLTNSAGVTIVDVPSVQAGVAQIRLQVTQLGEQLVTATLPDGRAGQIRLWGFQTQLPVWRIDVDPADLAKLNANALETIWVPVTLRRDGKTHVGKMRLHGGSSRTFPKKSFRLNLNKDQALADGRRKLVLRAEYVDKSALRNFAAYEVVRHATWLPASRLTYVHLRLNSTYYGVMLHPDRVDSHFLTDHGLNPEGSLYEADPPFVKSVPGGNLTVVKPASDYKVIYQQHHGALDYVDLIELIEVVLQLPDAAFEANVDRVVKVDDVLVFLAMSAVIQNQDWVKKNYYLYRDPTAVDARWTVIPWDLDLTLGHLWTEEKDVFDEQIFIDGSPYVGMNEGYLFYNQLADRLLRVPRFRKRYRSFIAHFLAGKFNNSFLGPRLDNALCRMQPDLLADRLKRAKNEELLSRVQEVRDFVVGRRTWLTTWLSEPDAKD